MITPLSGADYYDLSPSIEHSSGDVWTGLPTFGVLTQATAPGAIVTPACDLANNKADSVTYLPIVSVHTYLRSRCVIPDIKRAVFGQLDAAGLGGYATLPPGHALPHPMAFDDLLAATESKVKMHAKGDKLQTVLQRCTVGLKVLHAICSASAEEVRSADLELALGSKPFEDLVTKIVTNARSDTHFLPSDSQRVEWSGIPTHSVALLRYPLSIPLEVIDSAQRIAEDQWPHFLVQRTGVLPCLNHIPARPMKRQRLRPAFASDLLSRFTGLFGRLGGPDFTPATVRKYFADIRDHA